MTLARWEKYFFGALALLFIGMLLMLDVPSGSSGPDLDAYSAAPAAGSELTQ